MKRFEHHYCPCGNIATSMYLGDWCCDSCKTKDEVRYRQHANHYDRGLALNAATACEMHERIAQPHFYRTVHDYGHTPNRLE